jgi:hypothetical protein
MVVSFIGRGNHVVHVEEENRPQITDKLLHITLYRVHHDMSGNLTHNILTTIQSK